MCPWCYSPSSICECYLVCSLRPLFPYSGFKPNNIHKMMKESARHGSTDPSTFQKVPALHTIHSAVHSHRQHSSISAVSELCEWVSAHSKDKVADNEPFVVGFRRGTRNADSMLFIVLSRRELLQNAIRQSRTSLPSLAICDTAFRLSYNEFPLHVLGWLFLLLSFLVYFPSSNFHFSCLIFAISFCAASPAVFLFSSIVKIRTSLCQRFVQVVVAEWIAEKKALAAEKREQKEDSDTKLIQVCFGCLPWTFLS